MCGRCTRVELYTLYTLYRILKQFVCTSRRGTVCVLSSVDLSIVIEFALLSCQFYLRSYPEYVLDHQLPDIGIV